MLNGMAADIIRTVDDDVTDAITALAAAERELANWRTHLERARTDVTPGAAMQARRSSRIVAGIVAEAVARTMDVKRRADAVDDEAQQLRSVS
jgi:hypothetical protein